MMKCRLGILALAIGLAAGVVFADDGGTNPGYLSTSYSNDDATSVVKSAYGSCIHNGYYQNEYGQNGCGEAQAKETVQQVTFSESGTSLFNFNSSVLSASGKEELRSLVQNQDESSGSIQQISIEGHTDMLGALSYNQSLSQVRADVVKDFLVSVGVESAIITASGLGPNASLVSSECLKKYGSSAIVSKANMITANYTTASTSELIAINAKMAQLASANKRLVSCMAADRRVEITIDRSKEVPVSE